MDHPITTPRVLIVDDDSEACQLMAKLLENAGLAVAGICLDADRVIGQATSLKPDIILLDLTMPETNGMDVLAQLRAERLPVSVIIVTAHRDAGLLRQAIKNGADGFLTKLELNQHLISTVATVLTGDFAVVDASLLEASFAKAPAPAASGYGSQPAEFDALTPRESVVLELIAKGYDNQAIANELHISYNTVKSHATSIFDKLDVSDRTQAALVAHRAGFVR